MIALRDLQYEDNEVELLIYLRRKSFDGEIHKVVLEVRFSFGVQFNESFPRLMRKFKQEVWHEILWTQYDIERLHDVVTEMCDNHLNDASFHNLGIDHRNVPLLEQEFSLNIRADRTDYGDDVSVIAVCGISGSGSAVMMSVAREHIIEWVKHIKHEFEIMECL